MDIQKEFNRSNEYKLLDISSQGISMEVFLEIMSEFPYTKQDWAFFLNMSKDTLTKYIKNKTPLDFPYSERIVNIIQVTLHGFDLFKDYNNFYTWLSKENYGFDYRKGISLMNRRWGIEIVNDQIGRLEHGIFA